MESGEFDIYPEYTGTAWNMVLKEEGAYSEDLFGELQQRYNEDYDLHTYSDLAAAADRLIFGAEYDFFEREDGYDALCYAAQVSEIADGHVKDGEDFSRDQLRELWEKALN